ncbi:hypothetical protein TA3x_002877 [Tundrisphaera sp. TA3]|uniref:hypothetical protein n=1 Tax=Tundrisphaera sp. TA3 TaxID=3435775 RepID=UPI003EBE27A9
MPATADTPHLLASLERLIERLCSTDLTLEEAAAIRPRITGLLETIRNPPPPARCPAAVEGPGQGRPGRNRAGAPRFTSLILTDPAYIR